MKEPLDKNKLGKGRVFPDLGKIIQDELELVDKDHDKIKLIDEKTGELLFECRIGDKYHQAILEVGLNTILEKFVNENVWEFEIDKEWTPLDEKK